MALRDDEELLAALREAMRARDAVPAWFVEAGKNAFAWYSVDGTALQKPKRAPVRKILQELAQLTYDSHSDQRMVAVTRSETASIRALTFTSTHLSIELEVTEDSLLGQIIPPQPGTLEIQTEMGAMTTAVDEIGCFSVGPTPDDPFRLLCRTADGTDVLTGWISL